MNDTSTTVRPEKTPLMIGPGIVIKGHIFCQDDDPESTILILGRVEGDITTKGIVQIAKGGEVAADSMIDAGEVIVSGTLTGENVTVKANLLVLQSTGNVDVHTVNLPSGGLEQQRGGVLNARMAMAADGHQARAVTPVSLANVSTQSTFGATTLVETRKPTVVSNLMGTPMPAFSTASGESSPLKDSQKFPEDDLSADGATASVEADQKVG